MFHKTILSILTTLLILPTSVLAQFDGAADLIPYQGILADNGGQTVPDGSYSIVFTLYDAASGGNVVWTETQNVTTDGGIYNVMLGEVTTLSDIAFDKGLWLGIKVGADPEMVLRTALGSVPYALSLRNMRIVPEDDDEGPNVIGGWSGNTVSSGIEGATISGGGDPNSNTLGPHPNQVTNDYGTVSGGLGNSVAGRNATIGGGHTNSASGHESTIGGGQTNNTTGLWSTIGGGAFNGASGEYATIGGGEGNTASGENSTVGGGSTNSASNTNTTVGGGKDNTASGADATVGGGNGNEALGNQSTVSGGINNTALGSQSTVGGGEENEANAHNSTVAGGFNNVASGFHSTVGGGNNNTASGICSVIVGGCASSALGDYSFAAGYNATAEHEGSFVFSDRSTEIGLRSTAPNQFLVRAAGGLEMMTDQASKIGVRLMPGSGSWQSASSVLLKTDFEAIDPVEVLEGVVGLDIRRWRYKGESEAIRHVGPTSESFYGMFGLGGSDASIATVDADGVALAAIQGLYQQVEELKEESRMLKRNQSDAEQVIRQGERLNAQLRNQLVDMNRRLDELERMMQPSSND